MDKNKKNSYKKIVLIIGIVTMLSSLIIGAITQKGEKADDIYIKVFYIGIIITITGCFIKSQKKLDNEIEAKNNQIKMSKAGWIEETKNFFINEKENMIMINSQKLRFDEILDAELISDGTTVAKTDFTSMAIRSFAFGAVGGITAKKNNINYCNDLRIKITTKNLSDPIKYLIFIYKEKINKNSAMYRNRFNDANRCLSLFQIIINKQNKS